MALRRHCRYLVIVVFGLLPPCASFSQERGDPIGALTKISTFDRAQRVNVGKTKTGKVACYFREEGSSHSLDIGLTADGAFIRLETGDSRETTPTPPLRVFAGKRITKRVGKDEYDSGEYASLQAYDGKIQYYVPKRDTGDFVLVAKGDANAFFEMVARARTEFVVVQSAAVKKDVDIVAIYEFKTGAIPALLSCARDRIQ